MTNGAVRYLLLALFMLVLSACANEAQLVKEGNDAFAESAYDEAGEAYAEAQQVAPELAEPIYNQANTRYRQDGLVEAEQLLQQALESADPTLSQAAYYNLGNVHFNNQNWEAAIAAYQEALRLNPDDADARHNLELAMQQLAEQQQEEEEQQQQEEPQEEEEEQGSRGEEEQEQEGEEQQEEEESGEEEEQTADPNQPDESEEQQQGENTEQAEGESESDQLDTPLEVQELTADQARQLLEAIAQDAETLQEHLQQIYQAPAGIPGRDW